MSVSSISMLLLAVLLLLLGFWLFAAGLIARPPAVRRSATGFLLMVAAFCAVWLMAGATIPWPRDFVVVYAGGEGSNVAELPRVLEHLGRNERICFVRLHSRSDGEQPRSRPAVWQSVNSVLRAAKSSGWNSRVEQWAVPLFVDRDVWLDQIDGLADQLLRKRSVGFGRRPRDSVLVAFSNGSLWSELTASGWAVSNALHRIGSSQPREYFVAHTDSDLPPGFITAEFSHSTLAAGVLLRDSFEHLVIHLGSPWVPADKNYNVRVQFDDQSGGCSVNLSRALTGGSPNEKILDLAFAQLWSGASGGYPIRPGFHRMALEVTFKPSGAGAAASRTYRLVQYCEAISHRVVILGPDTSLGTLAAQGWREALASLRANPTNSLPSGIERSNATSFLSHNFYSDDDNQGLNERRLGTVQVSTSVYPPAGEDSGWAGVLGILAGSEALVLIEPETNHLERLSRALDASGSRLDYLIENGLHVMVVGPPVQPAGSSWATRLPATAREIPGTGRPRFVHSDARLYFLPDCSRPMWFGLGSKGKETALGLQRRVMENVVRQLHGVDSAEPLNLNESGPHLSAGCGRHPSYPLDFGPGHPAVYSPILLFSDFRSDAVHSSYAGGKSVGATNDLLPGALSARLWALFDEALAANAGPCFRPLVRGDAYPATSVVIFAADTLPMVSNTLLIRTLTAGKALTNAIHLQCAGAAPTLKELTETGARLYIVRLKMGKVGPAYQQMTGSGSASWSTLLSGMSASAIFERIQVPGESVATELEIDCSGNNDAVWERQIAAVARAIAHEIGGEREARLRLAWSGRTIDDRSAASRRAPETALELISTMSANAYVSDPGERHTQAGLPKDLPMVVSRALGDGSVTVLAYSPLAFDAWIPDIGLNSWASSDFKFPGQAYDGWGVQRFIDLTTLTAAGRQLPSYPVLGNVRELGDGATVQFDLWTRLSSCTNLDAVELEINGVTAKCALLSVQPFEQRITAQYRAETNIAGFCELTSARTRSGSALQGASKQVYLHLKPSPPAGRNALESLAHLSSLSGGAVLSAPEAATSPDAVTPEQQLRFRYPAGKLAAYGLLFVLMLMFSPLIRPWTAARHFVERRRRRQRPGERDRRSAALGVRATLVEFGLNPGLPEAIRQAGLPAGQRAFQAGDALSTARPATLLGFTETGRKVGLPPRLPTMRLRHASRSVEATVWIDASPSLFIPDVSEHFTKAQYAEALVRLLCGYVWLQGGHVRLFAANGPAFEPFSPGTDQEEVTQAVASIFAQSKDPARSSLVGPRDMEPSQALFLVSDLFSVEARQLQQMGLTFQQDDVSFRVVHLVDMDEFGLAGLGAARWAVEDRTGWSSADLERAYNGRIRAMKRAVESAGGCFASVTTNLVVNDCVERLLDGGVLSL